MAAKLHKISTLMSTNLDADDRLLVFLRAPSCGGPALLRYQWQCNHIDVPHADRFCVLIESTARAHADSEYAVVIDDGRRRDVQPPAVLAFMRTQTDPPWRWSDLATELRDQPDLFATLATMFRELCVSKRSVCSCLRAQCSSALGLRSALGDQPSARF